jgi:hypothetical protein
MRCSRAGAKLLKFARAAIFRPDMINSVDRATAHGWYARYNKNPSASRFLSLSSTAVLSIDPIAVSAVLHSYETATYIVSDLLRVPAPFWPPSNQLEICISDSAARMRARVYARTRFLRVPYRTCVRCARPWMYQFLKQRTFSRTCIPGTAVPPHQYLVGAQLGSNRPSPEQGILVVWAFFF